MMFYIINNFIKYYENFNNKYKIAIYSYNFGNYRDELKNIDLIKKIDEIDYYYYSDNVNSIKSSKWNIIKYPIVNENTNMDSNRFTSKMCKFYLPKELKKYDYIIHIDSKKEAVDLFNKNISLNKIYSIINSNKDTEIFFREHSEYPDKVLDIYNEIDRVSKSNRDNKYFLLKWRNKLTNEKWNQKDKFIDSDIFMRKYSTQLNNKLLNIIYLLESNKIKRDQLVIPYFIENVNNNINYKILNKNFN